QSEQPASASEHPAIARPHQPLHLAFVVVPIDARLNRLPVAERRFVTIAEHRRRRDNGLPHVRVGPRHEDSAHPNYARTPTRVNAEAKASANRSMTSVVRWTFTDTRRRDVPGGTVGGRMARTSNPSRC